MKGSYRGYIGSYRGYLQEFGGDHPIREVIRCPKEPALFESMVQTLGAIRSTKRGGKFPHHAARVVRSCSRHQLSILLDSRQSICRQSLGEDETLHVGLRICRDSVRN